MEARAPILKQWRGRLLGGVRRSAGEHQTALHNVPILNCMGTLRCQEEPWNVGCLYSAIVDCTRTGSLL
jgi:hypothetical protein